MFVAAGSTPCRRTRTSGAVVLQQVTLGQIKDGKMGNGKLKAMKKEEQGADGGWKLEWEAESSMDPKETVYGVDHRVMIDGAAYGCSRRTDTPEGQACVARACASLKKL
jgi:hypothetical protein